MIQRKNLSSFSQIPGRVLKPAVPEMDIIPKTVRHKTFTTLANKTKSLITAAQNGNKQALEQLCLAFEPLFRSEMRRDMFYNALGIDEGLSLARLKFIELVLTYNGADYEHFAGYVRCRIHFALYDEVKKVWADENNQHHPHSGWFALRLEAFLPADAKASPQKLPNCTSFTSSPFLGALYFLFTFQMDLLILLIPTGH